MANAKISLFSKPQLKHFNFCFIHLSWYKGWCSRAVKMVTKWDWLRPLWKCIVCMNILISILIVFKQSALFKQFLAQLDKINTILFWWFTVFQNLISKTKFSASSIHSPVLALSFCVAIFDFVKTGDVSLITLF